MIERLSNEDLLAAIRALIRKSGLIEAELLVHLGEIDERKLYLARSFPSMFAYCVAELGFSEDAAYNRIVVARAGRRLPALVEAVRSGRMHLAGVRLLVPYLTAENHADLLAKATGKSKRQIEELVATLSPKPPVPAAIRKLPERPALAVSMLAAQPPPQPRVQHEPAVRPLAEDTYKIQFTASRAFRDKLKQTQDLLRHRVPNGDMAAIFEAALDALINAVKKDRFALGRKPRPAAPSAPTGSGTRHIPDPIKRAVYERDGGRCAFTDDRGRRCVETGALEFDHLDGFARTHMHSVERIRLLCRPHNQYAAEQMYGRAFIQGARNSTLKGMQVANPGSTCPGTSLQCRLL